MILNLVLPTNRRIRIFAVEYRNRDFLNENVGLDRNQLANSVIYFQKQNWQFCLYRLVFFICFKISDRFLYNLQFKNFKYFVRDVKNRDNHWRCFHSRYVPSSFFSPPSYVECSLTERVRR